MEILWLSVSDGTEKLPGNNQNVPLGKTWEICYQGTWSENSGKCTSGNGWFHFSLKRKK